MTPQEQADLIALVQQMLATESSVPSYGAIAPPMTKSGGPEPWDLDAQAKAFNVTQDWGSLMSDPAILGGMMPGSITPSMLEPKVTYDPLKGWNMVEATYRNQPNSLEGMIAGKILNGQGAFAAYNDIVHILQSDPNSPEYQAIAPLVPPKPPGQWATNDPLERFDLDAVKKLADSYQSAINSEPVPVRDPQTGDFVRDNNGQISVKVEEETPQAQWFRETGTPLPWDEWSTNDFATETQQKRRDESAAKTSAAEGKWRDFRSQRPVQPTLTGADREAYINNLMRANMTTPDYPGYTNQTNRGAGFEMPSESSGGGGMSPEAYATMVATGINPASIVPAGVSWFMGRDAATPSDAPAPGRRYSFGNQPTVENASQAAIREALAAGQPQSTHFRGDAAWATGQGGSREGNAPARGSRYEAELRLRDEERRRGPTGREATAQTKKAWDDVTSQRRRNHQQLADEALRQRMISQLMAQGVTPYTTTMNSRRADAQRAGFGY